MSKLYRRLFLLAVIVLSLTSLYVIRKRASSESLYQTSTHLFDSITHLSLVNNDEKQLLYEIEKDKLQKDKEEAVSSRVDILLDPCTVINPINRGFIDLRALSSIYNEGRAVPWNSRGYDSGLNYTIGICSNPFKKQRDKANEVKDNVNSTLIGAYYVDPKTNKYVSIGEYSTQPVFRGRKLTLTYTNGSYCDNVVDSNTGERLRKSTILTFTCDREMMAKASVSYVGSFNDCNYFFEVRSHHACPTAAKANNLAAIWIFLFIFLTALFVYFSGGLLYKQMKSQRRHVPLK